MTKRASTEGDARSAGRDRPTRGRLLDRAIEAAFDAVLVTDQAGVVLEVGGAAEGLFGRAADDCLGRPVAELLAAPAARVERAEGDRRLTAVDGFPYEGRRLEATARHAAGQEIPVQVNVTRGSGDGPLKFICFVRDVGRLREAEERRRRVERELAEGRAELRQLALKLPLEVESERRRIARGLHDQVGNALALAKMRLSELRRGVSDDDSLAALKEIDSLNGRAMQEIRSLTFELSSPVLYELGLEAALKSLGKRLAERHDIDFDFSDDEQPKPLPEERQIILYRTIEELLVNVVKHAWASHVRIAIERAAERIRIVVEDDGVGLEPLDGKLPGPDGGFGLFGARQRLAHIDGELEIEGAFPSGTRATVSAPLGRSADRSEETR